MLKQYCHETKTLNLLFLDGYVEGNFNTKKRISTLRKEFEH